MHVADGLDSLTRTASQLARGLLPDHPFLVMGQFSMVDDTRQPPGRETAWAYAHVPTGACAGTSARLAAFVDRMEAEVERRAPGFRALIRARHVLAPPALEAARVWPAAASTTERRRSTSSSSSGRCPAWAAPRPRSRGLFLAGASAHPGGGVHGAPGANAAAAALSPAHRATAALARRLAR